MVLPPKSNEKKKKNTTIALDELQITEGHLTIFRHDHQKLLSAQKLSVTAEDITMNPMTESKKIPNQIEINRVEREPHRSFFNLFWQGILSGLKKQLI